jgi:hypothetical protein
VKESQDTMKMFVVDMENAENGIHTHRDLLEVMMILTTTMMDIITME